jgi:hypothetical protein
MGPMTAPLPVSSMPRTNFSFAVKRTSRVICVYYINIRFLEEIRRRSENQHREKPL